MTATLEDEPHTLEDEPKTSTQALCLVEAAEVADALTAFRRRSREWLMRRRSA